jgi:4-hydroxybutyrate CoA-transferase
MKYADLVTFRDDLLFNGAVQIGWFEHDIALAEKAAKHYVFHGPDYHGVSENDNLISINNTLMVDLTGQAASESIGTYQYSGTGGQVNFVQGATQSRGGKSILALSSTYQDKEGQLRSKIVPVFPEGTIVSTSRNDVEYIVTEYGVACLKWKSLAERVKELIRIAHPDFRYQLKFAAAKNHWI